MYLRLTGVYPHSQLFSALNLVMFERNTSQRAGDFVEDPTRRNTERVLLDWSLTNSRGKHKPTRIYQLRLQSSTYERPDTTLLLQQLESNLMAQHMSAYPD